MEKTLSLGAFEELYDPNLSINGGYYIPLNGLFGIKINYANRGDEVAALGWIAGGAIGGAIAGSYGGPVGAALGAAGGAVTGTIGTAVGDVYNGKATVSFSILGF